MKHASSPTASGPLARLRVVEVAGLGPLTFAAMLLADMGADVVRVVRPGHVEMERGATLRGRRQVELDLRSSEGREALLSLVSLSDVLLEGFRPGVMERLQLGPDQVMSRNDSLIYGRMTGWGQTGPSSAQAGHDINYIAVSGALHAIGDSEPAIPLNLIGDYGGGALYLAMGVLAAVMHARESGKGQVVDCAICDGTVSLLSLMHGLRHAGRWKDKRKSNTLDGAAPFYRTYRCRDGRSISVGSIERQFYQTFLERLQLNESQLFTNQHDRSLWGHQADVLEQLFGTRDRDEWIAVFAGSDACVAPVNSLEESLEDAHLLARRAFANIAGELQPNPAPRFSLSPSAPHPTTLVPHARDILDVWQDSDEA
ncbi:CaiB/BaiF CoA transferase family protein [Paraburkholderia sp. MM5482-R1]|uniref:CaiB/BaiF CoA transferase family protein n=1 Tax=unclassified Paraburkholderia TaxID=2615204 RepID=UPI003D1E9F21